TSLGLLGLLAAALVGAGGARAALAHSTFGWRQLVAGALAVVAVVGPALVLGAWTWDARGADGLALRTSDVVAVPAVGRQMQQAPEEVRVLAIAVDATAGIGATLLRHVGVQLSDLSRSTTVRGLTGGLGGARVAEPDPATTALA